MSGPSPAAARVALRRRLRPLQRRVDVLRATGRWRPDHIDLRPSGHRIFVDPRDERGWAIVLGLGRGHQPRLLALWQAALDELSPTLAVDVGANYGEFAVSGRYPDRCRVVVVEANPAMARHLDRSVAAHPQRDRFEVHYVLAGDRDGGTAQLAVDPDWSGTASAALDRSRHGRPVHRVDVPVRTVDALLPAAPGPGDAVVCKVDVEGWEEKVLAGMGALRSGGGPWAALVEFDPEHLRRAGSAPEDVLAAALGGGAGRRVDHDGTVRPLDGCPTGATDLLVGSSDALLDALVARADHPR